MNSLPRLPQSDTPLFRPLVAPEQPVTTAEMENFWNYIEIEGDMPDEMIAKFLKIIQSDVHPFIIGLNHSKSCFQVAVEIGKAELVRLILNPPELPCQTGREEYQRCIQVAIDERYRPEGSSPMHIAAANGYHDILQMLIDAGAVINIENSYGQTPLDLAAQNGQIHVLWQLINTCIERGISVRYYSFFSLIPDEETLTSFINQGLAHFEKSLGQLEPKAGWNEPKHFNHVIQIMVVLLEKQEKYYPVLRYQLLEILEKVLKKDVLLQSSERLLQIFEAKALQVKYSGKCDAARDLLRKVESHMIALIDFEKALKAFSFGSELRSKTAEKYFKQLPDCRGKFRKTISTILGVLNSTATFSETISSSSSVSSSSTEEPPKSRRGIVTDFTQISPPLNKPWAKRIDRENDTDTNKKVKEPRNS